MFFEKLLTGRVYVYRGASARASADRELAFAIYYSPNGSTYDCYSKLGSYRKFQNYWRLEPSPKHRAIYIYGPLGKPLDSRNSKRWYSLFYDGESGRLHREFWGTTTRTWGFNLEGWVQESWPRRLKDACPDLELPASLAINEKQTEARLSRMKAQDPDAVIRNFPGSELRALGANGRRNDKVRAKVTPKELSAFLLAHDRTVLKAMDGTRYVLGNGSVWAGMGRWILAIEGSFPVFSQGPEPYVLAGLVVELVPVVSAAPLGGADMDPARCLVDGAGVARGLDEGLDEHGSGAVALGPVVRQAPAD